ncbi:reticulon-4 receptor-like 1 [Gadus chalcogrammus]|uniref:reticulon-4 receptor-like 1 n=1 Tax=Gadus chalcogrammus TaxID=1042646 RepID=UPI0024C3331A|nr:reticulon-4 receptor-like 1 [Gadus chalcogrammus]
MVIRLLHLPRQPQDNQLEFLEDDLFIDLMNLSHLFLHGNRLWSLRQNTFRGLGALDRLLLHHNRLQWVDRQAFHDLRRLTTLYLFNNSLTQLAGSCLGPLVSLEYLRLNDNPWECDCKALSLWEWLRRFRGSTSTLACRAPPELANQDLKVLRKEELPSCPASEGGGGGGGGGGDQQGETLNHLNRYRNHHNPHQRPYLPHGDQHFLPSPSPLPRPPKLGRRNCTRRGRKGKGGGNEVEGGDKDYSPDGGKNDPSLHPRRKNKCIPRTSVDPPRGVLRANSRAPLHLLASPLAAWLLSAATLILC